MTSANRSTSPLPRTPTCTINTEKGITVHAPDDLPHPPSPPPTPPPTPPSRIDYGSMTGWRGSSGSVASIISVASVAPPPPSTPSHERATRSVPAPNYSSSQTLAAVAKSLAGSDTLVIPPIPKLPPPQPPSAPPLPPRKGRKSTVSRGPRQQRPTIVEATQKYIDEMRTKGKDTLYIVIKQQLIDEYGDVEFNRYKIPVQDLLR